MCALMYELDDIVCLFENDVRFLEQLSSLRITIMLISYNGFRS
jgi:hypothetical protein